MEKNNRRARALYERLGHVAYGSKPVSWDVDAEDGSITRYETVCRLTRKELRQFRSGGDYPLECEFSEPAGEEVARNLQKSRTLRSVGPADSSLKAGWCLVLGVARDLRSGQSLDGPGEAIACQEHPMARRVLAQLAVRRRAPGIDLMARRTHLVIRLAAHPHRPSV